jgi:NADH-quinone oxidoreductase subunit C
VENQFQTIIQDIQQKYSAEIVSYSETDMPSFVVNKDAAYTIIEYLFNTHEVKFLTDITGIHYPDNKEELGVVYHLHSLEKNFRIRIKAFMKSEHAFIQSLTPLFLGANWMERETYDFFGIHFKGHPNLKRILNVDDMIMFPLRKEFPLEDQSRADKNDTMFGR